MTINEQKAAYIGNFLDKKKGVIVNSGTLAILSALKLANIKQNDLVLISGYCCYSLFEAISNIGAKAVFINPSNFFNISISEIDEVIKKYNIKCFIATHQYGIVQDIKEIRNKYPNTVIIEDIAQAWNIVENQEAVGRYSDLIVTSFGLTKPLSYGQAGAVFGTNDICEYFDLHDRESRNKKHILLPYALYDCDKINEIDLVNKANKIVSHQREVASYLGEIFVNNDNVRIHIDNNMQSSVWQRFPIIIDNQEYIPYIEKTLKDFNILYQWQNELETWELEMVKNTPHILIGDKPKPKYILVRTRQNEVENVKRLLRRKI